MRILFLSIFFLFLSGISNLQAQLIYSCDSQYDADVKVWVADSRYDADLLVYKCNSRYEAEGTNQGIWFFTESRYDAEILIYFVSSRYDADLIIYFVDSQYDAVWENLDKLYLMFPSE